MEMKEKIWQNNEYKINIEMGFSMFLEPATFQYCEKFLVDPQIVLFVL
jgi:hypothetical protein